MLDKNIQEQVNLFRTGIEAYQERGLKVFASSSFQTHSIPMLHIISQIDKTIPIYFLNTGFHFPETLIFRKQIGQLLEMEVIDLKSPVSKLAQRDSNNRFLFTSDPTYCCYLNKTLPMESVLVENDVWITGVRRDQNSNRKSFSVEAKGPHGTVRFHPMLEWNSKMIWEYRQHYNLPEHPLEAKGYLSIGCGPCTRKFDLDGDGRGGRWAGMKKTECGLHTDLVAK